MERKRKKGSSRQVRDSSVVLSKKWNLTESEENEDNGEIMIEREEQKQNVNTSTEKNADNHGNEMHTQTASEAGGPLIPL